LQALTDLIQLANSSANSDRADAQVLIRADVEQNSFEFEIALGILSAANLMANVDLGKIVMAGELFNHLVELINFTKWIKGKSRNRIKYTETPEGELDFSYESDDPLPPMRVGKLEIGLYNDPKARKAVLKATSPLRRNGYDRMKFSKDGNVVLNVEKSDLPKENGSDLPILTDDHIEVIRTEVRIRKAAYERDLAWWLVYDGEAHNMKIDDEGWVSRFQSGRVSVPPGSLLDVDLEVTHTTDQLGQTVEGPSYRVIKVHSVILPPAQPTQGTMPFVD